MVTKEIVALLLSVVGAIGVTFVHEIQEGDIAFAAAHIPPLLGALYAVLSIALRKNTEPVKGNTNA